MAPAELIRVIACGVFRHALEHLGLPRRFPQLRIDYVESNLHLEPVRLRRELMARLRAAEEERLICLYGACAPDIDELCRSCGASRPEGELCHEMLLGRQRYLALLDEAAGTYFLEQELIRNFEASCAAPLELHDRELRELYFQHYRRLVYVRQPGDPDLAAELEALSALIELPVEVHDADLSAFEGRLLELIFQERPSVPPRSDIPRR